MEFKKEELPKHIAIIMDGNRRWARAKGMPVAFGHKEGAKVLEKIDEDKSDFIVVNFANPDMVGHTGVMEAAVKAVETVDSCVGKLVDKIVEIGGSAIITADHGNAELMVDPETDKVITAHSVNPVPFIVAGKDFIGKELLTDGRLSDIAPTLLNMMNLEKPKEMTGHSLIK